MHLIGNKITSVYMIHFDLCSTLICMLYMYYMHDKLNILPYMANKDTAANSSSGEYIN